MACPEMFASGAMLLGLMAEIGLMGFWYPPGEGVNLWFGSRA